MASPQAPPPPTFSILPAGASTTESLNPAIAIDTTSAAPVSSPHSASSDISAASSGDPFQPKSSLGLRDNNDVSSITGWSCSPARWIGLQRPHISTRGALSHEARGRPLTMTARLAWRHLWTRSPLQWKAGLQCDVRSSRAGLALHCSSGGESSEGEGARLAFARGWPSLALRSNGKHRMHCDEQPLAH